MEINLIPSALAADIVGEINAPIGLVSEDTNVSEAIAQFANVLSGIAISIAVIALIYAGILWATSAGDEEKIDQAKRYIRMSIVGIIIVTSAWSIARFVISAII